MQVQFVFAGNTNPSHVDARYKVRGMVLDDLPHPIEVAHSFAYPKIVVELSSCGRPAVSSIPLAGMKPDDPSIVLDFLIDNLEQILKRTVDAGGFLERVH